MARILIGTFPGAGHTNPFLPLARALVARGHEVRWNASANFRKPIEATGARFAASRRSSMRVTTTWPTSTISCQLAQPKKAWES
jgi:UDP:flavonoid glycosyltransferase YjiC (YdhE family)